MIQKKVRTYLKQSRALETIWSVSLSADMLRREIERIAAQTRMPERLREVYAALGDDPVLIAECLARPSLVDRLARRQFEDDLRIHAQARREIEDLRDRLLSGNQDPAQPDPRRTVIEYVMNAAGPDSSGVVNMK